jgi:hypothetical protein
MKNCLIRLVSLLRIIILYTIHLIKYLTFNNVKNFSISHSTTVHSSIVALMSSTVRFMTETRLMLDEPFDVRLNSNVTPGLLSLKMCPSGSADVNSRITLYPSEGIDECSKSILHSKRVKEPCFGTSHENVWGCPRQKYTPSCVDTPDNVQAVGNQAWNKLRIKLLT